MLIIGAMRAQLQLKKTWIEENTNKQHLEKLCRNKTQAIWEINWPDSTYEAKRNVLQIQKTQPKTVFFNIWLWFMCCFFSFRFWLFYICSTCIGWVFCICSAFISSSFSCDLLHFYVFSGLQCAEMSGPPMVYVETMCGVAQEKLEEGCAVKKLAFSRATGGWLSATDYSSVKLHICDEKRLERLIFSSPTYLDCQSVTWDCEVCLCPVKWKMMRKWAKLKVCG